MNCIPGYNVNIEWLPRSTEQGSNLIYAARSYYRITTYIGAQTSKIASGLASILGYLNKPIMGTAETSPILSDRNQYPTFLRVCPSDDLQGYALTSFVKYYNFTHLNLIYTNDIYGETLSQMISKTISPIVITLSRSFSSEITNQNLRILIDDILNTGTTTNIMACVFNDSTSQLLLNIINEKNALDGYTWIFADGFSITSTTSSPDYKFAKGILVSFPGYNDSKFNTLMEKYNNRDLTISKQYSSIIGTYYNMTGGYDPFFYDAMWSMLYGLKEVVGRGESAYDGKLLFTRMSAVQFEGITGRVSFDGNGNRRGSLFHFMNFDGTKWSKNGYWNEFDGVMAYNILWPGGRSQPAPSRIIPSIQQTQKTSSMDNSNKILGLAIVLVAMIILIVILMILWRRKMRHRLRVAPMGRICLVFTDIHDNVELWNHYAMEMKEALILHTTIIRRLIEKYKGYEVKTIGDSFMISFHSCYNAVGFSSETQMSTLCATWPAPLLNHPSCAMEYDLGGRLLFRGPRLKIGIHCGLVDSQINNRVGAVDYFGPNVNIAARVEGIASGGQILVTQDVKYEIDKSTNPDTFSFRDMGQCLLRGVGKYGVYEVVVDGLEDRKFPPLHNSYDQQPTILNAFRNVKFGSDLCVSCSRLLKCKDCSSINKHEKIDDTSSIATDISRFRIHVKSTSDLSAIM